MKQYTFLGKVGRIFHIANQCFDFVLMHVYIMVVLVR